MWATRKSDLRLKKWAVVCSLMIIIAVFLPVPSAGGFIIWPFQDWQQFDYRQNVLVVLGLIYLVIPILLIIFLGGKPLSALVLTYCCISQIILMGIVIAPIGYMADLFAIVNLLGKELPGGDLIAHLNLFGFITVIPVFLLFVALGVGYYLSIQLRMYRYPFALCGVAASMILVAYGIAFTNLYFQFPEEFHSLSSAQVWINAWPVLSNIVMLLLLILCILVQSIMRSPFFPVPILMKTFVFLGPVIILIGLILQMPETVPTQIIYYLVIFTKIMAGLYGIYFLLTVSLVVTIEQNTGVPELEPRNTIRLGAAISDSLEEDTFILD